MLSFIAHFLGYEKARQEADAKQHQIGTQSHPGGAIVALFPNGRININDLQGAA